MQRIAQIKMIQFASDVGNIILITPDVIIPFDVFTAIEVIWQVILHVQKKKLEHRIESKQRQEIQNRSNNTQTQQRKLV